MGGLDKETPIPTEIKLHQKSRLMEVAFSDGSRSRAVLSELFAPDFDDAGELLDHG